MLTFTTGQFVVLVISLLLFGGAFGLWTGRETVKYEEEYHDELFDD